MNVCGTVKVRRCANADGMAPWAVRMGNVRECASGRIRWIGQAVTTGRPASSGGYRAGVGMVGNGKAGDRGDSNGMTVGKWRLAEGLARTGWNARIGVRPGTAWVRRVVGMEDRMQPEFARIADVREVLGTVVYDNKAKAVDRAAWRPVAENRLGWSLAILKQGQS